MLDFKYHTYNEKQRANLQPNNFIKTLFDFTTDAMFILDGADLSIIECNNEAVKLFEARSKNQLLGLPSFRLYNYDADELSRETLNTNGFSNDTISQEMAFRTFHQNIFWGQMLQKNVSDDNGRYVLLRISKAANYIKNEEAMSTLLGGTAKVTGMIYLKELTRLLSHTFSSSHALVAKVNTGKPNELEVLQLYPYEGSQFGPLQIENSVFENVLRGYTSFYPSHVKDLFPDDKFIYDLDVDSFLGAPIFDNSGKCIGVIGILHTQSMDEIPNSRYLLNILASRTAAEIQRLKSKDLLREQTRELAQANHLKDRLFSVMANDLKAPLHTILSYSELISNRLDDYTPQQLKNKFDLLDKTIRNLYAVLENVTDWSKVQNEEIYLRPKKLNIHSIIENTYSNLYPIADIKKIKFENNISSEQYVWADASTLHSVIRNLLANAIRYSNSGGRVTTQASIKNNRVFISITDSCVSISPDEIEEYMSGRFIDNRQMNENQNQVAISYFLVNDFVCRNGGKIDYEYEPDKGYTFTFSLKGV